MYEKMNKWKSQSAEPTKCNRSPRDEKEETKHFVVKGRVDEWSSGKIRHLRFF